MLIGNSRHNRYDWLNPLDEALICAFLQGAVYAWCEQHGTDAFAARDFVGDKNYYWQGTPLIVSRTSVGAFVETCDSGRQAHLHNAYSQDSKALSVGWFAS